MENDSVRFHKFLQQLGRTGLNVFACARVSRLPHDLVETLRAQNIPVHDGHTLCLIGHGGPTLWNNLPRPITAEKHPFDRYTLEQIEKFNQQGLKDPNLVLLYPHSRWVVPLQRLGRALNLSRPSLLGLDLHAEYGPWFAYRAAFLTEVEIPEVIPSDFQSACASCAAKPCRSACPPRAVPQEEGASFHLSACVDFRLSLDSPCADRCLARMECPVGAGHRYPIEQIQYHMLRPAHLAKLADYKS